MSRADLDVRASQLRGQGVPFVRARVVLAERPTSAKAGDEAIIQADGSIEGFVGGTCAETTVRAQSLMLLDTKVPLLLRITPTAEPASQREPDHLSGGTLTVHNPCLSGGTLEIFLDPVVPAPLVQVHGAGPIAIALQRLAGELDYRVSTLDEQTIGGALGVVVASHGRAEIDVLTSALDAGVPYIALVASRRRGAGVLAELADARPDLAAVLPDRVHSPAGLDIGARTPAEIALSILAEVITARVRSHAKLREAADALIAASGSAAAAHGNDSASAIAGTAIDPVCGMTVAAVTTSLHTDHDGRRYYFCGPGCLRTFSANPAGFGQEAAAGHGIVMHPGFAGATGYAES